ncbi:hypothetical protein [Rhizobium bangladeshense]|uniref:hypothetical protein n=1 Tax=Rhizobium bangladeshense TaxID=1138189 RepID=UPI001C84061D|nr:hypothetical protein [Rhizobium bangladeshense]MBX4889760.1 hypothetical protein [Rhizobium bangladeshense]
MAFYTDGVVPWNSLDNNTRGPITSELEGGYPCGPADQELFNWTAGWPIGNIWNAILSAGITPDTDKLLDLARAIQNGKMNYAVAGGTANALTVALTPAITAHVAGMVVRLKIATSNTGAATLNDGAGALPITTLKGAALAGGDLPANAILTFICTGTSWMLAGQAYSETFQPAAAGTTVYVRTDGNDSNNGSANTAAAAFATIQGAINYIAAHYGASANAITIQLGITGTYAAPTSIFPGASINIKGDVANASGYLIQQATSTVDVLTVPGAYCLLQGLTLRNMNNGSHWATATNGGLIELDNVRFTANAGVTGYSMLHAVYGGSVRAIGPITVAASCQAIFLGSAGSVNVLTGVTVTLSGSLTFSQATAVAYATGAIFLSGAVFSGSATGPRYLATMNGIVSTQGGGASFIPGSTAGSTASGGQYD